jgi:hypothetical protein
MEGPQHTTDRDLEFLHGKLFDIWSRNQMSLISLADQKANVIAGMSIALITLIIILFSSGMTIDGAPVVEKLEFLIPLSIMMVFFAISALGAILALKPKIIRADKKQGRSILFFHNFYRKSLEKYQEEMRTMLGSKENVYDHLLTNMYYNGLVLERKYALLGLSYTVFLLAIVCSLTAYVVVSVM